MTNLVHSTHIRCPHKICRLIKFCIRSPTLTPNLNLILHHLPLTSLEITPGMKDCNRTPTETRLLQTIFRMLRFYPTPHTPGRPSSIQFSVPIALIIIPSFQLIFPPFRQRTLSNVTLLQWSERKRESLRIPPLPHIHTTPRYRTLPRTILRPNSGENTQIRSNS